MLSKLTRPLPVERTEVGARQSKRMVPTSLNTRSQPRGRVGMLRFCNQHFAKISRLLRGGVREDEL